MHARKQPAAKPSSPARPEQCVSLAVAAAEIEVEGDRVAAIRPAAESMEVKVSGSGESARGGASPTASGSKKRPPSRLQKQAPASLQLEQGAAGSGPGLGASAGAGAWGDGRAAIPLLSPLVMSPAMPVWEADQPGAARREGGGEQAQGRSGGEQQRGAARHGGSEERQAHDASPRPPAPAPAAGGGWLHPALPVPVAEPASLAPLFKSQCAVEARNAQQ